MVRSRRTRRRQRCLRLWANTFCSLHRLSPTLSRILRQAGAIVDTLVAQGGVKPPSSRAAYLHYPRLCIINTRASAAMPSSQMGIIRRLCPPGRTFKRMTLHLRHLAAWHHACKHLHKQFSQAPLRAAGMPGHPCLAGTATMPLRHLYLPGYALLPCLAYCLPTHLSHHGRDWEVQPACKTDTGCAAIASGVA